MIYTVICLALFCGLVMAEGLHMLTWTYVELHWSVPPLEAAEGGAT